MSTAVFSLYWDNIDPRLVVAQQSACAALQITVFQHRIDGLDHGDWIDWVMARREDIEVFLFLDIDCIPLSNITLQDRLQGAGAGKLVGAEGAANHLDPSRSYAGPWYVCISRSFWIRAGRPSARATPHADVCQNWTDTWRRLNGTVMLIPPTHCVTPKWDLPGRPLAYGIATTYGGDCFHLFESRSTNPEPFLQRCRQIAAEGANNLSVDSVMAPQERRHQPL
jgi:hypothetical protein